MGFQHAFYTEQLAASCTTAGSDAFNSSLFNSFHNVYHTHQTFFDREGTHMVLYVFLVTQVVIVSESQFKLGKWWRHKNSRPFPQHHSLNLQKRSHDVQLVRKQNYWRARFCITFISHSSHPKVPLSGSHHPSTHLWNNFTTKSQDNIRRISGLVLRSIASKK